MSGVVFQGSPRMNERIINAKHGVLPMGILHNHLILNNLSFSVQIQKLDFVARLGPAIQGEANFWDRAQDRPINHASPDRGEGREE